MKRLKPFISFYGSKWRLAPSYPPPSFTTIIEPFAGSASYSLLYPFKDVILCDKDKLIASMWQYLTRVSESEILSLPLLSDDLSSENICQEAKTLIGYWYRKGGAYPANNPTGWMNHGLYASSNLFWGEGIRNRIASQLKYIRHWQVIYGDYSLCPDIPATWFIDAPYQDAGKRYRHSSKDIDFEDLSIWTLLREGQIIVCENEGAEWIPFEFHANSKAINGRSIEVVYHEISRSNEMSKSLDYIPPSPDSEVLYPLAGNTQLVITTYESSSRSSPVDLTIQGLSRADLNIIVNALIHGEGFSIAGDEDDIATCEAIAEGQLFTPRSNINVNDMSAKSSRSSSRQPKPRSTSSNNGEGERGKRSRISSDDLQEAIDILRVIEPQGIAKSDILEQSGIDERLWIPAMKALIEEGVWRVEGVKRGARYYAIT